MLGIAADIQIVALSVAMNSTASFSGIYLVIRGGCHHPRRLWVALPRCMRVMRASVQRAAAYPSYRFAYRQMINSPCREESHALPSSRPAQGGARNFALFSAANGQSSVLVLRPARQDVTSAETPLHADSRRLNSALLPAPHELRIFSDVAVFFGESGSGKTEAIGAELKRSCR